MSKKYINIHSVRYHRPTEHCSSQQNQQNLKLITRTHTHTHATHAAHANTRTSQRERLNDKPPTLEKTRAPSHHGAGVEAEQGTKRARGGEHKQSPPKKLHPQHHPQRKIILWHELLKMCYYIFKSKKNDQSKKANVHPWAFSITIRWSNVYNVYSREDWRPWSRIRI